MMRALVAACLRLRFLVVAIGGAILVVGVARLQDVSLDVFPEFAPPLVEVQTEAPGLSAAEVESLISVPLESALNGTSWLETIRSKSVSGLSSVVIIFKPGTDIMRARQLVQERLAIAASRLPDVANAPVMLSPLSATSRAMKIGLSSDEMSLIELSTLARWTIRPRLMAVPGVANVAIWGQRDRQLQVEVDPERLRSHGVSLQEVTKAAGDATQPGAGGFIETPNQRLGIRHRSPIVSAADLARVPVRASGATVLRIGDIADVGEGHQPMIGDGIINDGPGILLIVEKQPWGNTLSVTRGVEEALEALRPGLSGVAIDSTIFRPATFIEMAIDNLTTSLLIGCVLVIFVLGAFLYEWRTALISLAAIPLSLVTAGLILQMQGATINTMVLAGLVIALGAVVDDAIIDVENIVRRLRQHRKEGSTQSTAAVILDASVEVRNAIVYATLIIVLALLPVFFMQGLSGAFFRPLAMAYALAVLLSMLVAMTVTPALSLLLLSKAPLERRESPLVLWLQRRYDDFLPRVLEKPRKMFIGVGVATLMGVVALPMLGESLLPDFKETDFLMHWVTKPGTSHAEMNRITIQASKELRAIPGVRNFGAHVGRAEVADEVVGINFTELWVSIDRDVDYEETLAKIQDVVDGYPGIYRDVLTYLRERIKEVLTGASTSIVVRIYGPDLEVLRDKAEEVGRSLSGIDGVVDLKVEPQVNVPHVEVTVDLAAAELYGLTPGSVRRAAATLIAGSKVGEIYEDQKVFDVVVQGTPETRHSLTSIRDLLIEAPAGGHVRLKDVAEVRVVPTPNAIKREAVSRRIDVGCNVRGRDLGAVARDIERTIADIEFPREYHPEVLGEYAERQAAQKRMLALGLAAVLGMLFLLQASFQSWRLGFLTLLTLPSALVGGVLAALISGATISLGSLVGFITVLGIAARNGIMLISHYQHLEQDEGETFGLHLVLRGARERLSPILMTAASTGLALVPLVVAGNLPGHEIEHPMAVVILGGLITSTLLNLVVLPSLYLRFGRHAPE